MLDDIAGIALNGVLILSSTTSQKVDAYFPKEWALTTTDTFVKQPLDLCLGTVDPTSNQYSYKSVSPCVFNSKAKDATTLCENSDACLNDLQSYMYSTFNSARSQKILGIAKDGHVIISPFDAWGRMISCKELDQCGGMFLPDGSYVYVFTRSFPYSMNCFGPAMPLKYFAACSNNVCSGAILIEGLLSLTTLSFFAAAVFTFAALF